MRSPLQILRIRELGEKGLLLPLLATLAVLATLGHGALTRDPPVRGVILSAPGLAVDAAPLLARIEDLPVLT